MRAGPGRTIIRASLPVDLLDDLDQEASRRGISTEELVDLLLVEHLPTVLAEEARSQLRGALDLAQSRERNEPQSEQSPGADDSEALNGEANSSPYAEHHDTARPALMKAERGGTST